MSQAIESKKKVVDNMKLKFQKAKSFIIVDYRGLTVEQDTQLRSAFRAAKVEYRVLKNTLVRRALNELGFKQFDADLNGPSAVAFSYADEVSAAKIFIEATEKFKKAEAKSGLCDGEYLNAAGVKSLASIPSREQLLAGLACALLGSIKKLAVGLQAVADQKSAQA